MHNMVIEPPPSPATLKYQAQSRCRRGRLQGTSGEAPLISEVQGRAVFYGFCEMLCQWASL